MFDWVEFYTEFANKLLMYQRDREELVNKVNEIYEITGINIPTLERDKKLVDIDPFTVFGLFNKSSMKESCLWQDKGTYNCNAKVHNLASSVE